MPVAFHVSRLFEFNHRLISEISAVLEKSKLNIPKQFPQAISEISIPDFSKISEIHLD